MPCEYSQLLGVPGQGAHFHAFGIAIVDVLLTVLLAWAITVRYHTIMSWTLVGVYAVAMFLHWFFCVPTTISVMLGLVSPAS
jgi:hypothetical protein